MARQIWIVVVDPTGGEKQFGTVTGYVFASKDYSSNLDLKQILPSADFTDEMSMVRFVQEMWFQFIQAKKDGDVFHGCYVISNVGMPQMHVGAIKEMLPSMKVYSAWLLKRDRDAAGPGTDPKTMYADRMVQRYVLEREDYN